jgi:hypothetical protein
VRSSSLSTASVCFAITAILSISSFGQAIPGRAAPLPAQTRAQPATKPCTLTQATLPKIGGVQMGSTYEDILSLRPEIAEDKHFQKRLEADNGGLTYIKVSRVFDEPEHDPSVSVSLFFTDRILSVIAVQDGGLEDFKSIHEAVESYSRFLNTGTDQWTVEYGYAGILKCNGFSFYANSYSEEYRMRGNSISIHADLKVKR